MFKPDLSRQLRKAVRKGDLKAVEAALAAGADAEKKDIWGWTPLMHAAFDGYTDIVRLLLDKGADVDRAGGETGYSPLIWAALRGHTATVKLLLERGASTHVNGYCAVVLAQNAGQKETPRLMLEAAAPHLPLSGDTWSRSGEDKIVHVFEDSAVACKLTEIFNFSTRERTTVSRNLQSQAESLPLRQSFDDISADSVHQALRIFRELGGEVEEKFVFKKRFRF